MNLYIKTEFKLDLSNFNIYKFGKKNKVLHLANLSR